MAKIRVLTKKKLLKMMPKFAKNSMPGSKTMVTQLTSKILKLERTSPTKISLTTSSAPHTRPRRRGTGGCATSGAVMEDDLSRMAKEAVTGARMTVNLSRLFNSWKQSRKANLKAT